MAAPDRDDWLRPQLQAPRRDADRCRRADRSANSLSRHQPLNLIKRRVRIERAQLRLKIIRRKPHRVPVRLARLRAARLPHVCPCPVPKGTSLRTSAPIWSARRLSVQNPFARPRHRRPSSPSADRHSCSSPCPPSHTDSRAGNTTSASAAVSVRNMSCTTTKVFRTVAASIPIAHTGFDPTTYSAFKSPRAPRQTSPPDPAQRSAGTVRHTRRDKNLAIHGD